MKRQVRLTHNTGELSIAYPPDWNKPKSFPNSPTFSIPSSKRFTTLDESEIELAIATIAKRNIKQALVFGATFLDENDPLLEKSHKELDAMERDLGQPSTATNPDGGRPSVHERVLRIREAGYRGNGSKELLAQNA
jgi:hypothetical protein